MSKESNIVTASKLAELLGLSERRVQQLANDRIIPKPKSKNKYDFVKSDSSYIKFLRKNNKKVTSKDKEELYIRKLQADTQVAEIDAEQKIGSVIAVNDVIKIMELGYNNFKSRVMQISDKLAPELALEDDIETIKSVLKNSHYEALKELSDGSNSLRGCPEPYFL